jgi:hypothetical protein
MSALNAMSDRVEITTGDVAGRLSRPGPAGVRRGDQQSAVFRRSDALRAPSPAKVRRLDGRRRPGRLDRLLLKAVREGGAITIIHRADRLADILALLAPKAGSFKIRPIRPSPMRRPSG